MQTQFDELGNRLARSLMPRFLCLAVAAEILLPVRANDFKRGPVINLSDPDILAPCGSNGREKETSVAVNPTNPKNIVVAWWGGNAKATVAAVSLEGGKRWQQVVIPGQTLCSGGTFQFAFDPWLSFAPNGDLYLIGEFDDLPRSGILLSKSTDGGLHWANPVTLFETADQRFQPDHPSITADPRDARLVYAIWDGTDLGHRGPANFSRTTDGGRSWEPARAIVQSDPQDYVQFSQILVLPDGTLVDAYELVNIKDSGHGIERSFSLRLVRSMDEGQTWSSPIQAVTMLPLYGGPDGNSLVTDPDTGHLVADPINPSFAMDKSKGSLYAVWEDGRFSNLQNNDIAFSMSADGGITWSQPIRVNQTPLNIPLANRQAFLPAVAVAGDGTIGVAYYDFRFNDANPGLPTDYWLVHCHPSAATPATDPASWGSELRLTDVSFDMETAPDAFGTGYFVGDYEGMATVGNDFLPTWSQPWGTDKDSVFFRRVGP